MATTAATEVATTSAAHEAPFSPGARARTEELYRQHARLVGGLCRALLRDRAEAEDAAQQVFLSAHRALLNGSAPREPAAWLATIARNECRARIRSGMRRPVAELEVGVATAPDALAEAIRRADLGALWAAVAELPAQQRDALLLREFGGLSYEELSAALAVSSPAVESLLVRARQRLRRQLEGVYAGLGAAGWGDALLRLLGGGAAPVAVKAAALGIGAVAITGGAAFVVPDVALHSQPRPLVRHVSHRAHLRPAPTPVAAAPAPARPRTVGPQSSIAFVLASASRQRQHESDGRRQIAGHEGRDSGSSDGGDNGAAALVSRVASSGHGDGSGDGGRDGSSSDQTVQTVQQVTQTVQPVTPVGGDGGSGEQSSSGDGGSGDGGSGGSGSGGSDG